MPLTVKELCKGTHTSQHESCKRILKQAERLVRQQHSIGMLQAWMQVPQWLFGMPVVEVHEAARYVSAHMRKSGFEVQAYAPDPYREPNTVWLHIDWSQPLVEARRKDRERRNRAKREQRAENPRASKEAAARSDELIIHLREASKRFTTKS